MDSRVVASELLKVAKALVSEQSADESYKAKLKDVQGKMKSIEKALKNHMMEQKRAPKDYGYAGDMGHVYTLLVDVENFLKNA